MIRMILRLLRLWPKICDEQSVSAMLCEFESLLSHLPHSYTSRRDLSQLKQKHKVISAEIKKVRIPRYHALYKRIQTFHTQYDLLEDLVRRNNDLYIALEMERCDSFLSDIHGLSLDQQQRRVVVTDEDRNLVIAGAGSGKTLTIEAKVKYLCEEKGILPEDILLIGFTRKSAEEMTARITKGLNLPVQATTFHKLGLDIISNKAQCKPNVIDDLKKFVQAYFNQTVVKNPILVKYLIEYFAYYFNVPADIEKLGSLGAVYEYEKGRDFETFRGKYGKMLLRHDPLTSFAGEKLKSMQEVTIANFLFLNGIKYIYEKQYPFYERDPYHKPYHPDFYLPEYDIYIEHFGVDKNERAPWRSEVEEKKYLDSMCWKRDLHCQHGTTLIETFSYYDTEGCLLEKLEMKLSEHGVVFQQPDFMDIFNTIYPSISEKYFPDFIDLCCAFINHFKSNGYQVQNVDVFIKKVIKSASPFMARRTALFGMILKPILMEYRNHLQEQNAVDFSDMINDATKVVMSEGYQPHPFKWIIIDEFQDISVARYKLVDALLKRTGAKLLCVGDDWQSIFRFTGSDISLFTEFERYFGKAEVMKIEKTYRNSQQLIDVAGEFVMKNPMQIPKKLRSDKELKYPLTFMSYSGDPTQVLITSVRKIISGFGEDASILLLGRTRYDLKMIRDAVAHFTLKDRNGARIIFHEHPRARISFLTIHKAKGMEADNVILLNFKNDMLGFPNKIVDDPLLELVLTKEESYLYAEERRLLYVALTRTKNRVYVLMDQNRPSEFFKDFHVSDSVYVLASKDQKICPLKCPRCKTGSLILRKGRNGAFVGCRNYPQCDYALNEISVLIDPKVCPVCQGLMVRKTAKYREYYQCTNEHYCGFTKDTVKYRVSGVDCDLKN